MPPPLCRILYVEDEPDIRAVAQMALEAVGGFAVIACASGQEALSAAPHARADLLLLDVMMPGMDGPSTLKALREIPATANTPVIFMTAKVQTSEIEHFKSLGALDVIPKPFDAMTVSAQISEIWQRCAGEREQTQAPRQASSAQATEDDLQALYGAYAADLPAIIKGIEALWARLVSTGDPEALKSVHRALHSLAGSAGTFGYAQLGKDAKALELALAPYLNDAVPPPEILDPLSSFLDRIKQAAIVPDTSD